jgi:hypothetical protein
MGFTRKALFIATLGLSGLVLKDNSKKKPAAKATNTAKAAKKKVRPKRQTKVTRPTTRAARRRKPQARRPAPQAARTSTVAQTGGAGNGTAHELERLADLHARGALTDEEFAAAKAKILGTSPPSHASGRDPATFPAVEASVAAARDLADLVVHDTRT